MRLPRPLAAAATAAAALVGAATAVGILPATPASAETGVSVSDVCPDTRGENPRINLLILLDTSASLRENDPANLRSMGTRDALQVIESLSSRFSEAQIEVTVDTFDQDYFRQQGWIPASGVYERLGDAIEDIASDDGRYTDYVRALEGAWSRFAARSDDCNLLIWFTDGEHATASDAEGEQRELLQLCSSPQMQSLRDHVWVGAVQLNTRDLESRLRYLYGEDDPSAGALECVNPLRGRVYDDFDPGGLNRVLRELIERSIPFPDAEPLPGEDGRPPSPEDFEPCTGGDGSRERPCVVTFDLEASTESFRAFVDLTFIERGIENPDSVLVSVQSPDGTNSLSIGGSGDIRPGEHPGQYLRVDPFGFQARSQYPSDLQIVGHQAAEELVDAGQWNWRWQGAWQLRFFGDTADAQADARKAAAVVRFQTTDSPSVDSLGIDSHCTLSGFVFNYPEQEYEDIELRLRLDAADGEPVYATRPSLTEEPLTVADGTRRFELSLFLDRLVAWDTPQHGGNDRNLREAILERGGLAAVAVLSQRFQYAGEPEKLKWERDIGRLDLTDGQLAQLSGLLDGTGVDHLFCLPPDPGVQWLPTDLALGDPEHSWSKASFAVTAVPGKLPATLSLDVDGVEIVWQDAAGRADALPASVRVEAESWGCEVPDAAGGDGPFTCPEPISVRIDSEPPLRPTLLLRLPLGVVEQPGSAGALLERLGYPPDSRDYQLRLDALAGALERQRRLEELDGSIPASIDPATGWLPTDLELAKQRPVGGEDTDEDIVDDTLSIVVDAIPGTLPATLLLDSVRILEGSDETLSGWAGWTCEVPDAAGGSEFFICPEPITVDLPSGPHAELLLQTTLCVAEYPGSADALLERSGYQPGSRDYVWLQGLIAEALSLERGCVVVGATEQKQEPAAGDKLREFLPMLAALAAAALAARVFVAWRLRPWRPIDSPDFVVVPLHTEDSLEHAPDLADTRRDICMDLTQRKASADIGGVRLRSAWLPLLLGRRPRLWASSTSGDCIGPRGCTPSRGGRCRADVGTDLSGGWTVEVAADEDRLIVWDLPEDSQEAQDRLDDATREAAPRLRAHLESRRAAPMESGAAAAGRSDRMPPESPTDAGETGRENGDPFADDDPHESDHDTDPFGRPTN
ncbi:MAG: VWA domain-containing protein [Acidimicrobiaceae bacterium]|nr:VWA domain-containing protein [Acidimicrobiaceae bacterium]MYK75283.1 VWA domain-containing protein [Acidimicrobiaceae bacterium]